MKSYMMNSLLFSIYIYVYMMYFSEVTNFHSNYILILLLVFRGTKCVDSGSPAGSWQSCSHGAGRCGDRPFKYQRANRWSLGTFFGGDTNNCECQVVRNYLHLHRWE